MKPLFFGERITLARYTATQDAAGEEVQSWVPLGDERAQVVYGRGQERRQAATEQGEQAATFRMHSNARTRGLLVSDRITHQATSWDIEGIALDTPKRGLVEITATRAT
jgi:SPP1 family predicted phage head-tail adaptor